MSSIDDNSFESFFKTDKIAINCCMEILFGLAINTNVKSVLDKNGSRDVERICRKYIASLSPMEAQGINVHTVMLDALLSALFLRTDGDSTKTYLTSKLNLKCSFIPDFKELIATLEKRLNAIMGSHERAHGAKASSSHTAVVGSRKES